MNSADRKTVDFDFALTKYTATGENGTRTKAKIDAEVREIERETRRLLLDPGKNGANGNSSPDAPANGNVYLSEPGTSKVNVWQSSTKGTEVTLTATYNTTGDMDNQDKVLWVEGDNVSSYMRDCVLRMKLQVGDVYCIDEVRVTIVNVQSVAVHSSDTDSHKIGSIIG